LWILKMNKEMLDIIQNDWIEGGGMILVWFYG